MKFSCTFKSHNYDLILQQFRLSNLLIGYIFLIVFICFISITTVTYTANTVVTATINTTSGITVNGV